MKSITQLVKLAALVLCVLSVPAQADDVKNLLAKANSIPADQQQADGWVLSKWNLHEEPADTGKIDGNITTDPNGHHCLNITSTDTLHSIQMWWQAQGMACAGGSTYDLSVSLKGTLAGGTARSTIGIYFTDATGKWLGYQEIAKDQSTSIPTDWQKVEGKVTAPENAVSMGVRIGVVYSDGQANVSYKDPVLLLTQ